MRDVTANRGYASHQLYKQNCLWKSSTIEQCPGAIRRDGRSTLLARASEKVYSQLGPDGLLESNRCFIILLEHLLKHINRLVPASYWGRKRVALQCDRFPFKQPSGLCLTAMWSIRVHLWLKKGENQVVYRWSKCPNFVLSRISWYFEHSAQSLSAFSEKSNRNQMTCKCLAGKDDTFRPFIPCDKKTTSLLFAVCRWSSNLK